MRKILAFFFDRHSDADEPELGDIALTVMGMTEGSLPDNQR
jgi:hypothetical protein